MDYFMPEKQIIIISGIDGSGKTSLGENLSHNRLGTYVHYYNLIPMKSQPSKKEANRRPSSFLFSFVKESLYGTVKLFHLYFSALTQKIIIDRTYLDVYIDLRTKFGNRLPLRYFLILHSISSRLLHRRAKKIQLCASSVNVLLQRKADESGDSLSEKIRLYKEFDHLYESFFKIDCEINSAEQVAHIAKSYVEQA
jgi:hypothetical protein